MPAAACPHPCTANLGYVCGGCPDQQRSGARPYMAVAEAYGYSRRRFLSCQASHAETSGAVLEPDIKHKPSSIRIVIGPVEGFMNVTYTGKKPFVASVSHHPAASVLDRPPEINPVIRVLFKG